MPVRDFPYQNTLADFENEAAQLWRQVRSGDPNAIALFDEFSDGQSQSLETAKEVIAKNYGVSSFRRIILSMEMLDGLKRNDLAVVRELIQRHPNLLHENARCRESNWGNPLSFAANLGHNDMIRMLAEMGARDVQHAFGRACLQGKLDSARLLLDLGATIERGVVMGCCETLNADGLDLLIRLGAELSDADGDRWAPVGMLTQTYSRNPAGKHACFDLVAQHFEIPKTPISAFHRGQIDALSEHFAADANLIHQRFALREIYPLELGCHEDVTCGLHGTSLDGTTLLHMAIDYDELSIAKWVLDNGADVNARAASDTTNTRDQGHTPLFNAVVSLASLCQRQKDGKMVELLLERGADPTLRATLSKQLRFHRDETMHEYRNVTPLEYAERFHAREFVNQEACQKIRSSLR